MYSTLEMTARNNKKYAFTVKNEIAEAIMKSHEKGGVVFAVSNGSALSVDLRNIIAMQVKTMGEYPVKPSVERKFETTAPKVQPTPSEERNKILFKFECKCGADYFATMYDDAVKCRCRECGDTLYIDRFATERKSSTGIMAVLATNRYKVPFVERERESE